jgi:hypothetical protein
MRQGLPRAPAKAGALAATLLPSQEHKDVRIND